MKFSAQIQFRPNSEIRERFSNEKGLLSLLKGLFIKKEVTVIEESFSATDVLSRLNAAFKSSGITNLVRVSHDDTEFYLDTKNDPNDLDKVIEEFNETLRNAFERFYEKIALIMEINHDGIDFVVELNLMRIHPVGEFPVQLNIVGLPESAGIENQNEKFKLFVDKLELNICKYAEVADINKSFLQEHLHTKTQNDDNEPYVKNAQKCNFFPLYGVTLGETTIGQLAQKGVKAKDYDSDKKLFKYYRIKDVNFWHNDKIANQIYITHTSPIPPQWRKCGLSWELSYNEWLSLFEKLGYFISIVKPPHKEWYSGQQTLVAEFLATNKISKDIQLSIEFDFNYSRKSSVMSKGTLYSLRFTV
jgi:hypothetical protein